MNPVRRKLQSREGASITFALLIFLVCAIASSIVIVAGSASAGRMSSLPQTDQRFYAVTSAAGLLKDQIDGKTVVVTAKKGADEPTYTARFDPPPVAETNTMLLNATRGLVGGTAVPVDYSLTATGIDGLNCDLSQRIENGLLVYTIKNSIPEGSASTLTYAVEMRFLPNVRQSAQDSATGTTRTTVTWRFLSMKKLSTL